MSTKQPISTEDVRSFVFSSKGKAPGHSLEMGGVRLHVEGVMLAPSDLQPCTRVMNFAKGLLKPGRQSVNFSSDDLMTAINHDNSYETYMPNNVAWLCLSRLRWCVVCMSFDNGDQYRGSLVSTLEPDTPTDRYQVKFNPYIAQLLGFDLTPTS